MFTSLQNPLALASRLLLAALFLPAGIGKLTGFAGTVGYITSVGLPMPTVAAAIAAAVEVLGSLALLAGTEWPFYQAALCGVICALGFYGLRRRADRRSAVAACAEPG